MVSNKRFNDRKINSHLHYDYQLKFQLNKHMPIEMRSKCIFHLDFFHQFSEKILMHSTERKLLSIQKEILFSNFRNNWQIVILKLFPLLQTIFCSSLTIAEVLVIWVWKPLMPWGKQGLSLLLELYLKDVNKASITRRINLFFYQLFKVKAVQRTFQNSVK